MRTKKRVLFSFFAAIVCVAVAGGSWFLYTWRHRPPALDAPIKRTFELIPTISSYTQLVETQMQYPDRVLKIAGVYTVDKKTTGFSSFSTSTLYIQGDSGHTFVHENISMGDNIFTRVTTNDKLLAHAIRIIPEWRHFTSTTIPPSLLEIAIVGPIQDNLALLSRGGIYLTLAHKQGEAFWGPEKLLTYSFKLSGVAADEESGPLKALLGRVGKNGAVDVWINPQTFFVEHLVISAPPYTSTTTISQINAVPALAAPVPTP